MALIIFLSPFAGATTVLRPGYEPVTRIVNFADLDLTNPRAVATLYKRIKSAADKVCDSNDSAVHETMLQVHSCTKRAIAQAVQDVNSSGLTTLHLAASNVADFR
ncbi:MAG: UrcA family protein [Steroidobacteraceae bacterium]